MSKSGRQQSQRVTYFKKVFKLLIHNITLQQQIRSTFFTLQCANYTSIPNATFNISINQSIDITTIDVTSNEQQKADLQVTLDLSHFAKGIKNDLAIVKFMVNKEKILAPSSVNFYTQPLANRKGTIQYKFIGQKTTEIFQDEVEKFNVRRDEVIKLQAQLAQNPQLKRLVEILDSKDDIIKTLQKKIASLIQQTRKLSHSLQRQQSQQKKKLKQGLSFNLNINASNNYQLKKINQKLTEENTYLHKRIQTLEEQFDQMQKKLMEVKLENNILQIQLGKRDILDPPIVNVNPSRTTIGEQSKRDVLRRITEHEFDQELERRSRMADSLFLNNNPNNNLIQGEDELMIKSKTGGSVKRPNNTMIMDKSTGTLLNPIITPRSRKQRSKSVLEPQFTAFQQQQLQQSRLYDQEQVMMELDELKVLRENVQQRNLQATRQQDGTLRYPKLQAGLKSSYRMIQRLNEQKMLLQQKLRRRDQQLQYLRRQLQRSKMNFKNFEKQLRQRSSNAKDQFQQRMAAIKMQTQMKMVEMRKQNRFSDYEFVMQQEKRQIQMEKMRYQSESLREKYEEALNQLKSTQLEKAQQINKFKTTQTAINKQKQMYKSKFYQMQDSFTKQEQQLSVTKQKAKQYEAHLMRIEQLQHNEQELTKKLQASQKANNQLKGKCKRYQDKFAEMEPKWMVYRQMENEFDIMKRKIVNLQKLNERFETRMEEMKKFALKLENAYYEKKSKNQPDKQFDQHYQKQVQQRLQMTYKKLRLYQREFYEQQQHELNQTKKQLIDFYYKKIVEENQRIDDAVNYNEQQRLMFKNQKEHEINIIKESKIEQIDKHIKKYQLALNKLLNSEQYMPKGLNEKVTFLQQKMRKFQVGEFGAGTISQSSQSLLKNTIDRLNDSVKQKQSQITQLKKTVGKVSDGSNLLKVSNIEATFANQRKSMIEQMAKSREIFSKSFQDLKRANAELLKQKSALQIQVQNYKFREQKLVLKNTQRQRQLQRVSKKSTDDFKRKITDLEKQLQKKSDESLKHKLQKEEFKQSMNNLIGELNATATLLEKRQEDNLNLEAQNEQLKSRIEQYEQAEKVLIQQVTKIKTQAEFNQREFKSLLEDRNQNFLKIEKIKNVQIEKLKRTIQQLQVKVQTQITQVLHTKRDLQNLQQQYSQISSQLQSTKVSYNIVNQNYQKVEEDSILRIHQLEQTNQLLERNLIEIAQQFKNTQMQLHQIQIINDSLSKQLLAYAKIKQELTVQQAQWIDKEKKYTLLVQEQTQKLSQLTNSYTRILEQVQSVQKENQSLQLKLIQLQTSLQQSKQKLSKKYDEINAIKGEKFQQDMIIKQLNADLQNIQHQKLLLDRKCLQLQQEINHLNEQLQQRDGVGKNKLQGKSKMQNGNIAKIKSYSKLKPPPKTSLLSSSNLTHTHQEMQASKNPKSSRALFTNQPQKSINKPIQQNRGNIYIDETVSLRGTQIKHDLQFNTAKNFPKTNQQNLDNSIVVQEDEPNRMRVWTATEKQQEMKVSQRNIPPKKAMDVSDINVDLYEQSEQRSEQDPNLQSQVSMRQQQRFTKHSQADLMKNKPLKGNNFNEVVHEISLQQQCQSLTSDAILEQYNKEIQQLKRENQRLIGEKEELMLENAQLKERLIVISGSYENSQKKNALGTALGLTGGLLSKQSLGQRGSVQSNKQGSFVPMLSLPSQRSMSPPGLGSKQMPRLQQANKQLKVPILLKSKRSLGENIQRSQHSSNTNNSNINLARSSVQHGKSSRRQSLQKSSADVQRLRELQLLVDELEEENRQLKLALEEEHGSNQKLMEELVIMQEEQEGLSNMIKQKEQQVQQLTEYYQSIRKQLQVKIQQLVQEQISKQTQQLKLIKTFQANNQQISILNSKIQQLEKAMVKLNTQINQLQLQKSKSYTQYRKYEQQSELEILKLKQSLAYHNQLYRKKEEELQLLAEEYFQLQNQHQLKQNSIVTYQSTLNHNRKHLSSLEKDFNSLLQQTKKYQEQRKSHNNRIHQLQTDIIAHQQTVQTINKATSMSLQKFEIKLKSSQQQKLLIKQKLAQRQSIIQSLKHQIALYNDETQQLKSLNTELSLQLQRTQKQLKQIMRSYQQQFGNIKLDLKVNQQSVQKYKQLIKQKDQQLSKLGRLYRKVEEQVRQAQDSQQQIKQCFERYKSSKSQQINSLMGQIQISHNQLQKCKTLIDKLQQQFISKQSQCNQRIQLLEQTKVSYKQKLLKYQTILQQLQSQLGIMSQRPSKQVFDQLQFENDLYKNRIQQLQQMIGQFGPLSKSRRGKRVEDSVQMEFKKYKLQKERQLDDLSTQIDKYSGKINQLQQSNFMLKKHIEKLKQELQQILGRNQFLQQENYDLKEDVTELRQEVEFYKGKRIENLSKLLNQTM